MKIVAYNGRIEAMQGDITRLDVDVVVNAANTSLLGGGGVDGAIHRAAGRELALECLQLNGCRTGDAKLTGAHKLPARYIVHAVGPVWRGGHMGEPALLASCYRRSLELAAQKYARTIAFPAISCGIYGYPVEEATAIALREVTAWLARNELPERVIFCCFTSDVWWAYQDALGDAENAEDAEDAEDAAEE